MRVLLTFLALCYVVSVSAQNSQKLIPYTGQANDEVALERVDVVTTYTEEPYSATCYKDVPRTVQECGNRTYSRRVCNTIPGQNVCRTVSNSVCRDVTKYRNQCSNGPSRQVCTNTPSKQVCTTSPSRRVCRDHNGKQVCADVGGTRSCRTVGGGQSCRTVPGQQTCRQVSYNDRVCTPVSSNVCTWKPSYQSCHDQPYSKYECWDKTVYDSVAYSCTKYKKVPHYHDVKKEATVVVNFKGKTQNKFDLNLAILENGSVTLKATSVSTQDIIVLESMDQKDAEGVVRAVVGIIPADKVVIDQSIKIESAKIIKDLKVVSIELNKEVSDHQTISMTMKITKKDGKKLVVATDLKKEAKIEGKKITVNLSDKVKKFSGKHSIVVTLKREFNKKVISENKIELSNQMTINEIKAKNTK